MATLDTILTDLGTLKTSVEKVLADEAALKAQVDAIAAGNLPKDLQAKVDAVSASVAAIQNEVTPPAPPAPPAPETPAATPPLS